MARLPDASPPKNYQFRNLDAAKRMRDTLALHQVALSKDELIAGRYVAIRLSDGGSDGVAYESRAAAVEHQKHNMSRCGYFRIPLERLNEHVCDSLLNYVRGVYDAGHREDPAHSLILPTQVEHLRLP